MQRLLHLLFADAVPETVGAEQEGITVLNLHDIVVARFGPPFSIPSARYSRLLFEIVGLMPGIFHLLDEAVIGGDMPQPAARNRYRRLSPACAQ